MNKGNNNCNQVALAGWKIFSTAMHSVKWYIRVAITGGLSVLGVITCIWSSYAIMSFTQLHPVAVGCAFFCAINIGVSAPALSKLRSKISDIISEETTATIDEQPNQAQATFAEVAKEFEEEIGNIDIDPEDD